MSVLFFKKLQFGGLYNEKERWYKKKIYQEDGIGETKPRRQ